MIRVRRMKIKYYEKENYLVGDMMKSTAHRGAKEGR
jgi:hypothetical protein